jgi:hypothetical protein
MIIPAYLRKPRKRIKGLKRSRHITINIQEWVICLWPYLCSIIFEKGKILPRADLGVSISGSNEPIPLKARVTVFGSMPKLVRINSVNKTPKDIWVTDIIVAFLSLPVYKSGSG